MSHETTVLGNFSITLPAPGNAQLAASGYVYADESPDSLNGRMDIIREALERQQFILEIPILEAELEKIEAQRTHVLRAYRDVLEKEKGGKLASNEKPHLSNYPVMIKDFDEKLAKGKAKLAQARESRDGAVPAQKAA